LCASFNRAKIDHSTILSFSTGRPAIAGKTLSDEDNDKTTTIPDKEVSLKPESALKRACAK
jgi:hypothetical protein